MNQTLFSNVSEIEAFFQQPYAKWFNSRLANQGPWARVTLVDSPENDQGFRKFWNQIPLLFGGPCSLEQFVCLMSIISNEQRGDFTPRSEQMGSPGHPGMAYLFDKVPGLKRSYNTLSGNKTAFQCFNDELFIAAHGHLPLGAQLARTTDTRWTGEAWPLGVATTSAVSVTGFVQQADFCKFRGRGFIQTTGRSNYLPLIEFAQAYAGENAVLKDLGWKWAGKLPDLVATESTTEDWDAMFQQTDLIVAAEAVRVHNVRSGNYLALSSDPQVLFGPGGKGSAYQMGLRISGGHVYAEMFRARAQAVLKEIQG